MLRLQAMDGEKEKRKNLLHYVCDCSAYFGFVFCHSCTQKWLRRSVTGTKGLCNHSLLAVGIWYGGSVRLDRRGRREVNWTCGKLPLFRRRWWIRGITEGVGMHVCAAVLVVYCLLVKSIAAVIWVLFLEAPKLLLLTGHQQHHSVQRDRHHGLPV